MGSILAFGDACSNGANGPTGVFCLSFLQCISGVCTLPGMTVLATGDPCGTAAASYCKDGDACYNGICTANMSGPILGPGNKCGDGTAGPTGLFCQTGLSCTKGVCAQSETGATATLTSATSMQVESASSTDVAVTSAATTSTNAVPSVASSVVVSSAVATSKAGTKTTVATSAATSNAVTSSLKSSGQRAVSGAVALVAGALLL
ncbi:hypothetical protein BC830DRAFT_1119124 [Chytriomyces sp. MP71]|nr:hypothetical protein BC830DRAFT_1119124 [Chytriomyces sp. MP71]